MVSSLLPSSQYENRNVYYNHCLLMYININKGKYDKSHFTHLDVSNVTFVPAGDIK